ncbi:cell death-inducing p53-target protein 1 isoform X1 [Rhinatrema bivittatum]|uniref:cell death-inducing p53-target protein 1 isoform X1 n=1 Tax=Rhinatrema bivittatum TaxID=194408 RepID=UPI00112BB9A6|nr:cell death-inducing p53-target protein 1 isoform X1 [Rhinatrema bivittatum]XP_029432326.1 cell death-inducing p53-target protein 1 isoform X1 [Rhinatrema bivittatum]XP_029432327.1 cell death-inducing p53-target protein 1 isoform X1 [Rhinatrema bivittatum]XP_029432329.1 cell death-inducing p53-target protein 1 isoform X1 [Rhinatrema bivittatum]
MRWHSLVTSLHTCLEKVACRTCPMVTVRLLDPTAQWDTTPPTSGHYPSASGHTATVILPPEAATTVTVLQGEIFHLTPVQTVCPRCQQAITTRISHEIGLLNMLLCCFCCAAGCDLGCCLIPCVIDEFKDVMHSCPNCKSHIYTYKRVC